MRLIEWEVAEDGYEEQIVIPNEKRELAASEGIGPFVPQALTLTSRKQKEILPRNRRRAQKRRCFINSQ
ncbi:MAG: hypothetical protein KJ573_09395 [Proteobacteria bacterium]|nr:hypothetical protein [Pseudomonadota bacterium]MBU1903788.1 hypothetical protein [Pseudomonadota bacterium]